jgi:hypothetical protein
MAVAIGSVLATDNTQGTDVDTTAKVQDIVNAYAKVFTAADGVFNFNAAPVGNAILETLGFTALSTQKLAFLQSALDLQTNAGVATHADLAELIGLIDTIFDVAEFGADSQKDITPEIFTKLGINGVTEDNIDELIAKIGETFDDPAAVGATKPAPTWSGVRSVLNGIAALDAGRQALVNAARESDGTSTTVAVQNSDFLNAGIGGISVNDAEILNQIFAGLDTQDRDSFLEITTITNAYVDARDKLAALADGAVGTGIPLTAGEFAALGFGQLASQAAVGLGNDLLDTLDVAVQVGDYAGQQQFADTVVSLIQLAAGTPTAETVSLASLQHIGLTGLDLTLLPAFHEVIAHSADDGSEIDTRVKLEAMVVVARQLQAANLAQITAYAVDPANNPMPNVRVFELAGVAGVGQANLAGVNSVLAATGIGSLHADTTAKVQGLVDGYDRIATGNSPSASDYTLLEINIGSISASGTSWSTDLDLLNDLVKQASISGTVTHSDLQAKVDFVNSLATVIKETSRPNLTASLADAAAFLDHAEKFGLIELDDLALEPFLQLVRSESSSLDDYASLLDLAQRANAQAAALRAIAAYAEASEGTVSSSAPAISIFEAAGINALSANGGKTILHAAVLSSLASDALKAQDVDSVTELSGVIASFKTILDHASPTSSTTKPIVADYIEIGVHAVTQFPPQGLNLLNDVIASKVAAMIANVAVIDELAQSVALLMDLAGTSLAPTDPLPGSIILDQDALASLHDLGLRTLMADDLANFYRLVAAQDAQSIDSVDKLRALARQASESAALERLRSYAAGTSAIIPTARDYEVLGIVLEQPFWVAAFNDALAIVDITLDADNTQALLDIREITDSYTKVLLEANGTRPDAHPNSNPTVADFAAIGAEVAAQLVSDASQRKAADLFMNALKNSGSTDVARVSDIEALATSAKRVMDAILSPGVAPAELVTPEDFVRLGFLGVESFNLKAIVDQLRGDEPEPPALFQPIDEFQAIKLAIADSTNRLPLASDLSIALTNIPPGGIRGGALAVANNVVTITANFDVPVDPSGGRYLVYGRVDGLGGPGISVGDGWQVLNAEELPAGVLWSDNQLVWSGVNLEPGAGKSIQIKTVDTAQERASDIVTQAYRYLDPARFANLDVPMLEVPGLSSTGEIAADQIRLSINLQGADWIEEVGAVRLLLFAGQNQIEIPSLFHAATRSLIPLYSIPEGQWSLSYQLEDLAGTLAAVSPAVNVQIIAPQNVLSNTDPFGYSVETGILLNAIARDRLAIRGDVNELIIDATGDRVDAIRELNINPLHTVNGALQAQTQIDLVGANSVDQQFIDFAQGDILYRLGREAFDAFEAMDLVRFRLYPQLSADSSDISAQAKADFAARVSKVYTGVMHQVDVKIANSTYAVGEFEARYYKIYPDGRVELFDWDADTGTGAVVKDTNNDGYYDLFTLFIREGGRGDVDGVADGVVLDPGFGVFFRVTDVPSGRPDPVIPPSRPDSGIPSSRPDPVIPPSRPDPGIPSSRPDPFSSFRFDAEDRRMIWKAWADRPERHSLNSITDSTSIETIFLAGLNPVLTTNSVDGFPIPVITNALGGLQVYNGQVDLMIPQAQEFVTVIDYDTFMHDDSSELILLELALANGDPLPDWIVFNGKTGSLKIVPPEGFFGTIVLRLFATDRSGATQSVLFRVVVNEEAPGTSVRTSVPIQELHE